MPCSGPRTIPARPSAMARWRSAAVVACRSTPATVCRQSGLAPAAALPAVVGPAAVTRTSASRNAHETPAQRMAPHGTALPSKSRRAASLAPQVLLERENELAAIEDLLAAARAGRGGLATIEAAAGLGKTRLLDAAVEGATAEGMRVLAARGFE